MSTSSSNVGFRMMACMFRIRDLFSPRINVLNETGIMPEFHVLDFGCGPGSYVGPASKIVGESGKVYALDVSPLAVRMVKKYAEKNRLTNVETIQSDRETGLPDATLDLVLLYDTLHHLRNPQGILAELHRVLKPGGTLSASDHHLGGEDITTRITAGGLFTIAEKGKKTFRFIKTS